MCRPPTPVSAYGIPSRWRGTSAACAAARRGRSVTCRPNVAALEPDVAVGQLHALGARGGPDVVDRRRRGLVPVPRTTGVAPGELVVALAEDERVLPRTVSSRPVSSGRQQHLRPLWPTMYSTSAGAGEVDRHEHAPDLRRRRSSSAAAPGCAHDRHAPADLDAEPVEAAGLRTGGAGELRVGPRTERRRLLVGSSTTAMRSGYTVSARPRKSLTVSGTCMSPPSRDAHRAQQRRQPFRITRLWDRPRTMCDRRRRSQDGYAAGAVLGRTMRAAPGSSTRHRGTVPEVTRWPRRGSVISVPPHERDGVRGRRTPGVGVFDHERWRLTRSGIGPSSSQWWGRAPPVARRRSSTG